MRENAAMQGNCPGKQLFYTVMSGSARTHSPWLILAGLLGAIVALWAAAPSSAAIDTYLIGDGHEGAVVVAGSAPLSHSAPLTAAANSGDIELSTGAGQLGADATPSTGGSLGQTGFEVGRLVLVLQASGLSPAPASGDQSPIALSDTSVGQWELARISALEGSLLAGFSIELDAPLVNSYASGGAQVVTVPEFTDVSVQAGSAWTANSWDGASGGVTAFLATGEVDLADPSSSITATGRGFRGGQLYASSATGCTQLDGADGGGKGEGLVLGLYPGSATTYASRGNVSNGGGGGDCSNAGGGGGGNAGPGGVGGQAYDGNRNVGGLGGALLSYSAYERAVFGGGGGAGDQNNSNGGAGGNGGGLVFIRAGGLTGAGRIAADGAPGEDSVAAVSGDGAGGGGAGGVVYARFTGTATCANVSARGGDGGDEPSTSGVHGPGGGGGGGVVLFQHDGDSCPASISNGAAGTVPNGGGANRGATPSSTDDPDFAGEIADVPPGGLTTPTLAVSAPGVGDALPTATPTISGSTSIEFALIHVRVDDGPALSTTALLGGQWVLLLQDALADGSHSVSVSATAHGITSQPVSRSFTIDTSTPLPPTITDPVENSAVQTDAPTLLGGAEPYATVEIYLGAALAGTATASSTGAWSFTHPMNLADATYSFTALQIDLAGNASTHSSARTFRIDARTPTATIHAKPAAATNSRSASFNFSADESASFQCKLDGSGFSACIPPVFLSGLPDGSHTFVLRARDVSGNYSPEVSHTWTIDATPPVVSITQNSPPPGVSPVFSFSSNESGTTFRCRVAGIGVFVTCSSPFHVPSLAPGQYSFELRATDAFGNTSQQSAGFAVQAFTVPGPPLEPGPPKQPTPTPEVCPALDEQPGRVASVTLRSAKQSGTGVRFSLRADQSVLASLELRRNGRMIASRTESLKSGSRTLTVRSKKPLPSNTPISVRFIAITTTGGKSALDAVLQLNGRSRAVLESAVGTGATSTTKDCASERGAKKAQVSFAALRTLRTATGSVPLRARSSEWTFATVRLTQHGKVLARRSLLLRPLRASRITLRPSTDVALVRGEALLEIRAITAWGVRQTFARKLRVSR